MKYVYIGYGSPEELKNKLPKEERPTEYYHGGMCVLFDSLDNFVRIVGTDGGEPEDNTLHRDYSWVIPELNRLQEYIEELEKVRF